MIKFKTPALRSQFNLLHPGLKHILYWLSGWVEINTSAKRIIVTDLIRSQEEQDEIYGNDPRYGEKPWKSVHQFGRGADISVHRFITDGDDADEICREIEQEFPYGDGRHQSAIHHQVGNRGKHIHIQVRV